MLSSVEARNKHIIIRTLAYLHYHVSFHLARQGDLNRNSGRGHGVAKTKPVIPVGLY